MKIKATIGANKLSIDKVREWVARKGRPFSTFCEMLENDGRFTFQDQELGFIDRQAPLTQAKTCRWACPACGYYHLGSRLDYLEHLNWLNQTIRLGKDASNAVRSWR